MIVQLTAVIAAAVHLIVLHNPDGHQIDINPAQVTSLRAAPEGQAREHFTGRVRCMINLTDGKFVTVVESCDEVRLLLGKDSP